MNRLTIPIVLLAALATASRGDRIVLTNGKVLTGTIVGETDDRLSLQVSPTISLEVRRSQVARVYRDSSRTRTRFASPAVVPPDTTPPHIKANRPKLVCFAQISGPIESDLMVTAVRRSCAEAVRRKAHTVVFEIDTPGGRLDLMLEIASLIERLAPIPTIAYVSGGPSGGAYSAGAVLAIACERTYMAPGTAIGAAAPVHVTKKKTATDEKYISAIRAKVRSLAQKNDYPPKIAAAMVDAEIQIREAKVDGKTTFLSIAKPPPTAPAPAADPDPAEPKIELGDWITTKGKLLTLTAIEAQRYGIAAAIVPTRQELVDSLRLTGCRVADLATKDALDQALKRRRRRLVQLEASIASHGARAVALDPQNFRYARHHKKHGIYQKNDFLDDGRLWRRRSDSCIKSIDACLDACREKLILARTHPELGIVTRPVEARMTTLLTLRERVASEFAFRGSEK